MAEQEVTEVEVTELTQLLTVDEFLEQDSRNMEPIKVGNIPGFPPSTYVLVKPLSQSEREQLDESIWANVKTDVKGNTQIRSLKGYKPRAVHLSVIDAEGNKLFTEKQAANLSGKAVNHLFEVIEEASGLKMDAMDDAAKK